MKSKSKPFQDAVCFVTGAGLGLGQALSRQLFAGNASIMLADVNVEAVEQLANQLDPQRQRVAVSRLDVSDREQFRIAIEETVRRFGRLDFVFNNAGVNCMGDIREIRPEDWVRLIDVNLWGVIHGTILAYEVMLRQKSGHIVNIASGLGITPAPRNAPYGATKAAVVSLSESLRIEARDLGVRVSVVCPGWIQTPMMDTETRSATAQGSLSIGQVARVMPFRFVAVDQAAARILRGVARGESRIVFPLYVRFFAWLYRHCSPLTDWWNLREIRTYRKMADVAKSSRG